MAKDLRQNPRFMFALAFLRWVDPIEIKGIPPTHSFLSVLEMLPTFPKRAVVPTVSDAVNRIHRRTEVWDAAAVEIADNILKFHDVMTLTEARKMSPLRRRRD